MDDTVVETRLGHQTINPASRRTRHPSFKGSDRSQFCPEGSRIAYPRTHHVAQPVVLSGQHERLSTGLEALAIARENGGTGIAVRDPQMISLNGEVSAGRE